MFDLGTPELLVILVIAFLVFGSNKLPKIGADLGKALASLRKGVQEAGDMPGVKDVVEAKKKVDQFKSINKFFK